MVVTGTRRGLGRMLAEHYAGHGYRVVGCSREPFGTELENYEHVLGDVSDEAVVVELFRRARGLGDVGVLINNAGVASMNHALLTPAATVREMLETTVLGTFLCCREGAKAMRRKGGAMVNLSSVHVPLATVGTSIYGASKCAVEHFTRVFAREVAGFGIRVVCLRLPVVSGTGMAALVAAEAAPEAAVSLAATAVAFDTVAAALDRLIGPGAGDDVSGRTLSLEAISG